jgi:hypothetical protein
MLINPLAGAIPPAAPVQQPPLKADEGTARIPLNLFPNGVKPGDRVSITITGVDSVAGTATIVADEPTSAVAPAPEGQDKVDTSLLTGPMDDLKSYLYQKTLDQES